MKTPTLSFCITTRNRSDLLRETLSSIAAQATEEVEVVIVDGASEDDTPEVVRSFDEALPHLRYERRTFNSGIDRDYARAAELASGHYCWFFSDDDLLLPGAVQTVLQSTTAGYSLVVVNAEDRDADLQKVLRDRRLILPRDRVYLPAEHKQLFEDTAEYLSFIPGVVVRKDVWRSREIEPFLGSLFAHVGVIFQRALPNRALVLAKPLISIRNGTISWASRSFEIWMFLWPRLIWSLTGLPEQLRRKVTARRPWQSLSKLLIYRAMGAYSLVEYRRLIAPSEPSPLGRLRPKSVALAPGRLVNALALAAATLLRPKDRFTRYNLRRSRFYWRRFSLNRKAT